MSHTANREWPRPPFFALPSLGPFAHAGTETRKADLMLEQAHSQGLRGCGCLYNSPRNASLGLGAVGMGVKGGKWNNCNSIINKYIF